MQTRTIIGIGGVLGVAALAVTQMGFQAQDRQYKKTLAYMHDGREKIAEKMSQMSGSSSSSSSSVKK